MHGQRAQVLAVTAKAVAISAWVRPRKARRVSGSGGSSGMTGGWSGCQEAMYELYVTHSFVERCMALPEGGAGVR